ncbi:hypothetical protein EK21DRAFT_85405 [Setomelanomma holmii]|uniref:Uncharacterized protein n=1 Tax=Setomelanomma holmii TaxID=210430 RepID=A0A9P4HGW0_9PLEO|nr:hypothetical protein EK21DRAFT_85405 [Setomelanomma holmii]
MFLQDTIAPYNRGTIAAQNRKQSFEELGDPRPRVHGAKEAYCTHPRTPVTPFQRLAVARHAQTLGNNSITSPARSTNSVRSCERLCTHPISKDVSPCTWQLASPTRLANIRVRRSNYGSTLLQSPARPGYIERMRRMFEDAGRDHQVAQSPKIGLYPQLPNISRKASALSVKQEVSTVQLVNNATSYRPESLCLSTTLLSNTGLQGEALVSLPHPSERSSGSWSDDSGYIITVSRDRSSNTIASTNEQIYSWLANIIDPDDMISDRDHGLDDTACLGETTPEDDDIFGDFDSTTRRVVIPTWGSQETLLPRGVTSTDDHIVFDNEAWDLVKAPSSWERKWQAQQGILRSRGDRTPRVFSNDCKRLTFDHIVDDHIPSPSSGYNTPPQRLHHDQEAGVSARADQILEEGGIQLSPLSPNVCIERGPSRYHSDRTRRALTTITSPCRDRSAVPNQAIQLKENVVARETPTKSRGLLTPLGNRLNIRRRHAE